MYLTHIIQSKILIHAYTIIPHSCCLYTPNMPQIYIMQKPTIL